ncbi:polysaccharide deacetylase family protein [Clostridium sp. CH2]|uniref:polysaccharide deacetylase family protein n=1 Tax=Clostridium sp. CH2 TaxID=2949990 RepID=UPI00207A84F6|nr:polysaccharide deacetylase family protein [Clostridium sp. CH2]
MIYIYIEEYLEFKKQIEYTFKTIFNILKIKIKFIETINNVLADDIVINYGKEEVKKHKAINIKPGKLFTNKYLSIDSLPNTPLKKYNNHPVIYLNNEDEPYCKIKEGYIITNIDVVQSIFFVITCYEEAILFEQIRKDKCDRFPTNKSLAFKEKFTDIPIANEYINWIFKWIKSLNSKYKRKLTFENHKFGACLTHDVDRPFKYTYALKNDIKRLKSINIYNNMKDVILHTMKNIDYKYDPYYTFDYIRKVEKKYNFNSSFYFMTGGETNYDNNYQINNPIIINLIKKLEEDNCEVGYHYSFNASEKYILRENEKKILDSKVINKIYGGRNHYLRFRSPQSWNIGEKTGLLYDTTLGYNDIVGFRCGLCTPYRVFDIFENKELDLWEIPLVIMDGALKNGKSVELSTDNSIREIIKYIEIVKKYNGIFTLLWHNSSFNDSMWLGSKKVYENVLKYLYENEAFVLTGREIIKKIRGNNYE